jgi:hypothetical protein
MEDSHTIVQWSRLITAGSMRRLVDCLVVFDERKAQRIVGEEAK